MGILAFVRRVECVEELQRRDHAVVEHQEPIATGFREPRRQSVARVVAGLEFILKS